MDFFCRLLKSRVTAVADSLGESFECEPTVSSLQAGLSELALKMERRIVLFFDDAAHIGRETALQEFFDVFRTISSSVVSCKAAIYPGVTRFGTRFDVYNDATVLDVSRNESSVVFGGFFEEVMNKRYPVFLREVRIVHGLDLRSVATFLGRSVLGNMRAFIFACNELNADCAGATIGLKELNKCLLSLASNYYWPLMEELEPKLGVYGKMLSTATEIAECCFVGAAKGDSGATLDSRTSVTVHREVRERLAKPFEILEYTGFIALRDASRSLKSGGRGYRYAVNLCTLLEKVAGSRLTRGLFDWWMQSNEIEPAEFSRSGELSKIIIPDIDPDADLAILAESVDRLVKSRVYPYGLTADKLTVLRNAGVSTIGDLAACSDEFLDSLYGIGPVNIQRIRSVVGQAIWM